MMQARSISDDDDDHSGASAPLFLHFKHKIIPIGETRGSYERIILILPKIKQCFGKKTLLEI